MAIEPAEIMVGVALTTLLITVTTQWVRYEKKLGKCELEGINALQEAAEVKELLKELTHDFVEHKLEAADAIDRAGRDNGDGLAAMRTKVHELETWSRDQFVRIKDFDDMTHRMEKLQEQMIERVERRLERIEKKLDHHNGSTS